MRYPSGAIQLFLPLVLYHASARRPSMALLPAGALHGFFKTKNNLSDSTTILHLPMINTEYDSNIRNINA